MPRKTLKMVLKSGQTVTIRRLAKKLGCVVEAKPFVTIRDHGYKIRAPKPDKMIPSGYINFPCWRGTTIRTIEVRR